ncbi:hypothetical protein ADIS_4716 [Lunatimonas lonarensis]|uniref:Uncharacterized protein n=1 Tax=Lunatimonas lonarensis TaxID=1232681 RepID=R7ZL49_9BACT|nr:hypothetical protein ADIS_4716 [Lunatimonas lonarensis]
MRPSRLLCVLGGSKYNRKERKGFLPVVNYFVGEFWIIRIL